MKVKYQELRQEIVNKSLQAFHAGLFAGTSGNMSVYLKEEELMLITPTSVRYETMTAEAPDYSTAIADTVYKMCTEGWTAEQAAQYMQDQMSWYFK